MLREWLRKGEVRLHSGPHAERARQDAELLMMHVVGRDRAWLLTHLDIDLPGEETVRYYAWIERREAGEPIQYITGEQEFYGLPFHVTRDVLIPRPETEHLVDKVIEWAARQAAPRIVDVGTGSGAIAVALAHALPRAHITATDLSERALAVARQNAVRNGAAIRFLRGDLLAPVAGEPFDVVASNPPYVAQADRETLSVEVREHEPALALFAGDDGLALYRRLIPEAFEVLTPGGLLALEFGYGQSEALSALLREAGFERVEFIADLQGIPRVACAWRG